MAIFHRYSSEMHGNYRRAALVFGAVTGVIMGVFVLARWLLGKPCEMVDGYAVDGILLVMLFICSAYYRQSLPEKKITLKEAMLFGTWFSLTAAVVYGISLWLIETIQPQQTVVFSQGMMGKTIGVDDADIAYWSLFWSLMSFVRCALLGAFGAFIAALFLRNEKAPARIKKVRNKHSEG